MSKETEREAVQKIRERIKPESQPLFDEVVEACEKRGARGVRKFIEDKVNEITGDKPKKEQFVDQVLTKILGLSETKEYIKDVKTFSLEDMGEEYTDFEAETEAIEEFLQGEDMDIFEAVPEIFQWLRDAIKDEIEWIVDDPKTLADKRFWKLDEFIEEKIEGLCDDLIEALKKKHGK